MNMVNASSLVPSDQERPELQVMILYEDVRTGARANSLLDRISQRTGVRNGFARNLWVASILQKPLLREQAAVEAASADIVLLSVSGTRDFIAPLQDWLMRWQDHKEGRPYAFGVLLDPDEKDPGVSHRILASVKATASATGVDFFCSNPEETAHEFEAYFNEIEARATSLSGVLDEILKL